MIALDKAAKKAATVRARAPTAVAESEARARVTKGSIKKAKSGPQTSVKKHQVAVKAAATARTLKKPLAKRLNTLQMGEIRRMVKIGVDLYVIEAPPGKDFSQLGLPPISDSKVKAAIASYQGNSRRKSAKEPVENSKNELFIRGLKGQAILSRQQHIDDGSLIKSSELWKRLGFSRQAGSKAISEFRIFSVDGPRGASLCPAFFADPAYDRSTLEAVSKELGSLPGPVKWQFFTTPKLSLNGKTPLEAIKRGQINKVLLAAAGFRER